MDLLRHLAAACLALTLPFSAGAAEPAIEVEYRYDGAGNDPLHSAFIDIDDNVILAGAHGNTNTATANISFVSKLDPYGRELWSRTLPANNPTNIAVQSDRNGIVIAAYDSATEFGSFSVFDPSGNVIGGATLPALAYWMERTLAIRVGRDETFVMARSTQVLRYAYDGSLLWGRSFSTVPNSYLRQIALTDSGTTYAVGNAYIGALGGTYPIVSAISPEGAELWSHVGSQPAVGYAVREDSSGNAIVAAQSSAGIILSTYSPAGIQLATTTLTFGGPDTFINIDLDETDNIYLLTISANSYVVSKLDSSHTVLWSKPLDVVARSLDVDPLGHFAISGSLKSSNFYTQKAVALSFDADGNEIWRHAMPNNSMGRFAAIRRTGEIYAGGQTLNGYDGAAYLHRYRACGCTTCAQ